MAMSQQEMRHALARRYMALDPRVKELFLAEVGYWLSFNARDTFKAGTTDVEAPSRLRAFSESHHRIFEQLRSMMAESPNRYPDEVFANIVVDNVLAVGLDPTDLLELLSASETETPAAAPRPSAR
jgi:hypothetical protein